MINKMKAKLQAEKESHELKNLNDMGGQEVSEGIWGEHRWKGKFVCVNLAQILIENLALFFNVSAYSASWLLSHLRKTYGTSYSTSYLYPATGHRPDTPPIPT